MKNKGCWIIVVFALLVHAFLLIKHDTRIGQLEEVMSLANEISSTHTRLLTGGKMKDFNKECPKCGGPVYQDRADAIRNIAHCDDCGEEFTDKEYATKILIGE